MDEASPHIFSCTQNLSKNIVKWVSVNLSGEITVVDDFIRHILLSLCNKVITAKDRVLFFCQDIAQEPGNQLRVQEPDEANSVEEMGWKGGEKRNRTGALGSPGSAGLQSCG